MESPDTENSGTLTFFAYRPRATAAATSPSPSTNLVMPNCDKEPPKIDPSKIPTEEVHNIGQLTLLLAMLNYYVRSFEADLQLYEFAANNTGRAREVFEANPSDTDADETLELLDGWPIVAARDGAMSIYHFGKTLDGIDTCIAKMPSLDATVDRKRRKSARRMFQSTFPDFIDARHAVAHSADKVNSGEFEKHVFTGSWKNQQIHFDGSNGRLNSVLVDILNNRQYSNTWKGRVISYRIAVESLDTLVAIRDEVYMAFETAKTFT